MLFIYPTAFQGNFFEPALPQRERLAGRREELLAARGATKNIGIYGRLTIFNKGIIIVIMNGVFHIESIR